VIKLVSDWRQVSPGTPVSFINKADRHDITEILLKVALSSIYYFHLGTVKGRRLLDIGCGPNIHNVMPAAKWFDEIILSDYTPANLEAQKQWLRKDKDAADWTQFFKHYSKLDGNEYVDHVVTFIYLFHG
jgi:hypothetical protein